MYGYQIDTINGNHSEITLNTKNIFIDLDDNSSIDSVLFLVDSIVIDSFLVDYVLFLSVFELADSFNVDELVLVCLSIAIFNDALIDLSFFDDVRRVFVDSLSLDAFNSGGDLLLSLTTLSRSLNISDAFLFTPVLGLKPNHLEMLVHLYR